MKITKLEKHTNLTDPSVVLKVEITIDGQDLINYDYSGFDKVKDEDIPDILVAVGRMYKKKIKNGHCN